MHKYVAIFSIIFSLTTANLMASDGEEFEGKKPSGRHIEKASDLLPDISILRAASGIHYLCDLVGWMAPSTEGILGVVSGLAFPVKTLEGWALAKSEEEFKKTPEYKLRVKALKQFGLHFAADLWTLFSQGTYFEIPAQFLRILFATSELETLELVQAEKNSAEARKKNK